MMYGAGNNNLDISNNGNSYVIQDVQDMEKVGSQPGMNIIAMVSSARLSGNAKYYKIEHYDTETPDSLRSTVLTTLGSKSMAAKQTLTDFINFCAQNYPAHHYLLVIDDHGAGWPGTCSEDLPGGDHALMSMPDLKDAIANSSIRKVDILTFHACLMAMAEVAYEIKDVTDFMTACQFTMPMENVLGADLWLDYLKSNLGASDSTIAVTIAQKVLVRARAKGKTTTYAAIRSSAVGDLGARIGAFGNQLSTEGAQNWDEVLQSWQATNTSQLDAAYYCDLLEFASIAKQKPGLSTHPTIVTAANDLIANIRSAVIYTETYCATAPLVTRNGLNVHFPRTMEEFDSTNYVRLAFRATNWHQFIWNFVQSIGGGGQDPTGRCCYNNNANCAVNTQAACQQLTGNWTQGIDCNTACGGGGATCPATCANAVAIQFGQAVTQCQFTGAGQSHWFKVTVAAPHTYHFTLNGFPQNADYDLYTYVQCADYPNNPFGCSSDAVGPEDFDCTIQSGAGDLLIEVRAYQAPYGAYNLLVTQTN
jgi:hypothetical protein